MRHRLGIRTIRLQQQHVVEQRDLGVVRKAFADGSDAGECLLVIDRLRGDGLRHRQQCLLPRFERDHSADACV